MKFNSLIPELSVTNLEKSKEFYVNIGFEIKYEREEDKLCFLQLEEAQLMIQEINNIWPNGKLDYPFGRGINFSIELDDLDYVYNNIKKHNYKFYLDLCINSYRVKDKIYNDREFIILDPDGYMLRFNS